tara:strand:- start:12 stop:602 length:591 start_codon:yes stop_codon:yes gene_type:complete
MKKLFTIIITCFIIQYNSNAQEFNAGISAGLSTSQVSGDNLGGFNKAGVIIGGFVNRKINSLLKVQLEMIFIQKGSSNPKPEDLIGEIHLNYIEEQLILSFKSSEKVSLDFGLHISTLIKGYYHDKYGIMENQIEFNRFEIGALCGISYQLNDKISLNTRLANSILPIADHASGQTYGLNKGKYNTGLCFILKYQI